VFSLKNITGLLAFIAHQCAQTVTGESKTVNTACFICCLVTTLAYDPGRQNAVRDFWSSSV